MRSYFIIIFLLLLSCWPVSSHADAQAEQDTEQIRVSSDRLEADEKSRSVTFYGNVKTRKANMVIYADKMTLHYSAGETEEVDRVEIDGRLRIVQDDRIATADHGLFQNSEGRILLSGNAEVHQGGNSIVGDEIEYYLDEARSVVKSQPDSRVNAVFSPGSKK
jgi:lipopolysaccharide export system protein LptA